MSKALFESMQRRIDILRQAAPEFVEAAKEACEDGHIEAIKFFVQFGKIYDEFSDMKKAYNEIYDNLSRERIPELMREAGVKTITIEDVGRVTVAHRFSCSIIDKAAGYEWLRDNDLGDIITETVNSSTLAATAKNLLETEGREMPHNIFKTGTLPYTSVTKR